MEVAENRILKHNLPIKPFKYDAQMMIKALLFDIGGVLFHSLKGGPRHKWEQQLGLAQGQLAEIVFTHPLALRATIGQATPDEVWQAIGEYFSLSTKDLAILRVDFWNDGEWDIELLDFVRSIKPKIRTGTISDAWLDARQNVKPYVNYKIFDVIVFSAEEGLMKPDPAIYHRTLSRLSVDPHEAVFVDDRLTNIAGAQQLGMHAIHHVETQHTIKEILNCLQTQF
jgi:HAD superfamily hydrolase (TIGR01549 family)